MFFLVGGSETLGNAIFGHFCDITVKKFRSLHSIFTRLQGPRRPVKSGRAKINRAKINKQALGATAPPFMLHLHAIQWRIQGEGPGGSDPPLPVLDLTVA